jgi:acid phosphatase (class A)
MKPPVSAERLALARQDQAFSSWVAMQPVLGAQFTAEHFPATARVFTALVNGINPVIVAAKTAYGRQRPYVSDPSVLRCDQPAPGNGASASYPSTHAALGWGTSLVMAELVPSRAAALLQRGVAFGESRHICGFHYPSDIEAARIGGAAVVARLHAEPSFQRDMGAARRELARAYSH